jgi:hypothetical protein
MANCIICGINVVPIYDNPTPYSRIIKYQCPICKDGVEQPLEWTASEHKDNQNWNVRHTRALEAQVAELQRLLAELTLIVENHLKE